MDSWCNFKETLLPNKTAVYRSLNLENIFYSDHKHTQKVWNIFNMENMGDYHELYPWGETLLLSDICQNFSDKFLQNIQS